MLCSWHNRRSSLLKPSSQIMSLVPRMSLHSFATNSSASTSFSRAPFNPVCSGSTDFSWEAVGFAVFFDSFAFHSVPFALALLLHVHREDYQWHSEPLWKVHATEHHPLSSYYWTLSLVLKNVKGYFFPPYGGNRNPSLHPWKSESESIDN